MVQIIAGDKGKGKTKYLLDKANQSIKDARGSVVYLDKSSKHMYELSNKIRLVNVAKIDMPSDSLMAKNTCGSKMVSIISVAFISKEVKTIITNGKITKNDKENILIPKLSPKNGMIRRRLFLGKVVSGKTVLDEMKSDIGINKLC